jgi:hypothetical protein
MRRLLYLLPLVALPVVAAAQTAPSIRGAVDAWITTHGVFVMPNYRQALADLDDDRRADAVVLLSGPDWCDSKGCQLLVFRSTTAGFEFVSATTAADAPIRVSSAKSNGWHSLIVGAPGRGNVLLPFDGTKYPSSTSDAEKVPSGQARAAKTVIE